MNSNNIKEWFLSHRRSLPWRDASTPYRVWISEVMLQQTQVAVVVPYFQRWMEVFATIEALAFSPFEQVLKMWEGLGYYSRARHIHEAAQFIVENYGGEIPDDPKQLAKIKGIGPYTQGAIRCFAFRQKATAVDGNVLRVLSRFFAIEESIDLLETRKKITELAAALLPDEEPWLVSEGLIELGAMICKKVPQCNCCPLKKECLAFRHQRTEELPKRKPRPKATILHRQVAVIDCAGKILIQKGKRGKVMADLYEFPYAEGKEDINKLFEKKLNLQLEYCHPLPKQQHAFTCYRVHLFPHLLRVKEEDERYQWKERDKLNEIPFSSGHRRILNELLKR